MIKVDAPEIRRRVASAIANAGSAGRLIGFEAVEIQRFVTASSRPIAIQGASEALKRFDNGVSGHTDTIFAGGGRGLMLVPESIAAKRIADIKTEFRDLTHGAPLSVADVPFDPSNEAGSLRWLWMKQAAAQDACDLERIDLDFNDGPCADCQARAATRQSRKPDAKGERVCDRCDALIDRGRDVQTGAAGERWTLDEIADSRGLMAVVCADGNNLGRFFRSLDSLVTLAAGSNAVSAIFRGAHVNALKNSRDEHHISPVTGGDDIKAFLTPSTALDYVIHLIAEVEKLASNAGDLEGLLPSGSRSSERLRELGVGVGILIAPYHVPITRLVEHALRLEKQAKGVALSQSARSTVRIAIMMSDGEPDTADEDEDVDKKQPGRRSERAVRSVVGSDWKHLVEDARSLGTVKASQRSAAANTMKLDPSEFENWFLYQVARSSEWQRWFQRCGVDWRDRAAVRQRIPDRAMLSLARLGSGAQ